MESRLRCIRCGGEKPLLTERKFVCACGGLYDVVHDFSWLTPRVVDVWKNNFDNRCKPEHNLPQCNSGVWRFHELIMPDIPRMDIVSLGEGLFPIWEAGQNLRNWVGGDLKIYILPEGLGPTGSFKDMGGTVAFTVAKKAGIKAVACASTGDTSAMAAAYAAAAGMTCAVVLPKGKVTDVQMAQPIAHGAKVILIPGSFDECMRVVRELVDAERVFPVNSINPTRIEGHQASVFLACQFLGWRMPDAFVVPVGNGSNSSSVGKGMRLLRDLGFVDCTAKLIGVQSEAANPLARSWESVHVNYGATRLEKWKEIYVPQSEVGETTATAALIGRPVSYEKVMREIVHSDGAILTASEQVLNEAVLVAGQDGHFVCPQTGTALAGLKKAVGFGFVKRGGTVFVVSTATGLKFPNVPVKFGGNRVQEAGTCNTGEVADLIGV